VHSPAPGKHPNPEKKADMCPTCVANAAAVVAGAGSTGGVLAVCIGKLKKFFAAASPGAFQKTKERQDGHQ
jgi:hypothetical protein